MFVDSHCHLDFPELAAELPSLLDAMAAARVTHALCISVNLPDWPAVHALAHAHANLYATVGVHPDYPTRPNRRSTISSSAPRAESRRDRRNRPRLLPGDRRPRVAARALSHAHTRARRTRKAARHPHAGAAADTLAIMREEGARDAGGVMHCFTETWDVASAALDMGFHISMSGIVTFRNAQDLKDVARRVPLDRLLIETDSPYLAPVPFRGKRNQPAYVAHVAAEVARLRDVPPETIGAATSANFFKLFHIDAGPKRCALTAWLPRDRRNGCDGVGGLRSLIAAIACLPHRRCARSRRSRIFSSSWRTTASPT
jgi:TatD DNase family protein